MKSREYFITRSNRDSLIFSGIGQPTSMQYLIKQT